MFCLTTWRHVIQTEKRTEKGPRSELRGPLRARNYLPAPEPSRVSADAFPGPGCISAAPASWPRPVFAGSAAAPVASGFVSADELHPAATITRRPTTKRGIKRIVFTRCPRRTWTYRWSQARWNRVPSSSWFRQPMLPASSRPRDRLPMQRPSAQLLERSYRR